MAENLTLARPYAEAAFQLAKAAGNLPAWSESLGMLAVVTASDEALDAIDSGLIAAGPDDHCLGQEHRTQLGESVRAARP